MVNAAGVRHWVKFHLRTEQGVENLTDDQAGGLISGDRESHQRDLYEATERGEFPSWKLFVQVMPEADAAGYRFHPFDLTKVWSKADYPQVEAGVLTLDRNPENYFADVEQAAFTPADVVPGISFSPDKMLQGRLFSYGDAARYRLGVNHHRIPVNHPHGARLVNSYHRDGAMRVDGNQGGVPGVQPNNFGRWTEQPAYAEPAQAVGATADRFDFREDDSNYYEQPGNLFRLMTGDQQQTLFDNTARAIKGARRETVERHVGNCAKADPACGEGVCKACEAIGAL
ncbi:catalase [Lentzea sp. DG1S-22]|uniref:catalase n=1 Tax=Lentzea sp. DG1S-22 TaxID=3108822 RepID=UPI003FA55E87